jgi:serine/threonine protein kinase
VPLQPLNTTEPIPGYSLKERIGAGGYGEVWTADAPGGLTKAIKFVYGYFDDYRATNELKALNRIKAVRHPFLLSLERIEVVDQQLVIVTELADSSLKDRFKECRDTELPGIPRDELLGYLRDAADGLDFLSENFSLQHLDIKPENLLLVGGRVKVADFGLVKDVHEANVSVMGGLTPMYAPPEVFDGRPSHRSDQYSLAIVYQEMLTGELPFAGRTAAQLTSQHLHGTPCLDQLPAADRAAVGRALSKDPQQRFPTCRAMIDALLGMPTAAPRTSTSGASQVKRTSRTIPTNRPVTEVGADDLSATRPVPRPAAPAELESTMPRQNTMPVVTELPPLDLSEADNRLRPTLFVGIGGLAGRVLRQLRRRLHDRFGSHSAAPVLQMLLLDTDRESLVQATCGDERSALPPRITMALPLRKSQDYRNDSKKILQTLSRRWLYNIPRTLQTEGLRPLGRLAFVDHAPQVFERLHAVVAALVDPEARQLTAQQTGLEVSNLAPRVFVVAASSGGAGSGMVLDVAYALRAVLAEFGLGDEGVCGVLLHGTDRGTAARDLAIANTFACLSELHHYSRPGGCYPGDAACGLPPFRENNSAFADTYLLHLGDQLADEDFEAGVDRVAEYLYQATATPAAAFFEECRQLQRDKTPPGLTLRSFGICQIGYPAASIPQQAVEFLCQAVLERWSGAAETAPQNQAKTTPAQAGDQRGASALLNLETDRWAAERAAVLEISVDGLMRRVRETVAPILGADVDALLGELVTKLLPACESGAAAAGRLRQSINALLGPRHGGDLQGSSLASLEAVLADAVRQLSAERGASVTEQLLELLEQSRFHVPAAQRSVQWFTQHLQKIEKDAGERRRRLDVELDSLERLLMNDDPAAQWPAGPEAEQALLKYLQGRFSEMELRGTCRLSLAIREQLANLDDHLRELRCELLRLSETCKAPAPREQRTPRGEAAAPADAGLPPQALESLLRRLPELAPRLDEVFHPKTGRSTGGLRSHLGRGAEVRDRLGETLRGAARNVIRQVLNEAEVAALSHEARQGAPGAIQRLRAGLDSAKPRLLATGGGKRLLMVHPPGPEHAQLSELIRRELNETVTVVSDSGGEILLCYEVEQLAIEHVAADLIGLRQDYVEMAARLRTRVDVPWSPPI